jgi:molybdate transport system substrate-binding protein
VQSVRSRGPKASGRRSAGAWLAAVALSVVLVGASASAVGAEGSTAASAAAKPTGSITVSAAASLTGGFTTIGTAFEKKYKGTTVTFNFGSSGALELQIEQGAPADVFASADQANMKKVTDPGNAKDPRVFAHNRLALLVKKGNPKKIGSLKDFDKSGVTFVLCAVEVPCGKYGAQALAKAGVKAQPKSLEQNVKGVVTKVTTGQVDAGIGYVTDSQAAAASADSVQIPDDLNVVAEYPIAVLKQSANANLAYAFLDYVLGPDAQAILARFGFTGP